MEENTKLSLKAWTIYLYGIFWPVIPIAIFMYLGIDRISPWPSITKLISGLTLVAGWLFVYYLGCNLHGYYRSQISYKPTEEE